MYEIYKITSPSGKCYVGQTKRGYLNRWAQHKKKARRGEGQRHPFYCAIRKYGADSFIVEKIDTASTPDECAEKEKLHIAEVPKDKSYNLSPGGELDGAYGGKVFWGYLDEHPEERATYIEHLKDGIKATRTPELAALHGNYLKEWLAAHPKERWKNSYRSARIANKKCGKPPIDWNSFDHLSKPRTKEQLYRKYKKHEFRSEYVTKMHQKESDENKARRNKNISISVSNYYENLSTEDKRKVTTKARAAINREHQAKRASEGQKAFWTELKKDPERYAAYMEKRNSSLKKTIVAKGMKLRK